MRCCAGPSARAQARSRRCQPVKAPDAPPVGVPLDISPIATQAKLIEVTNLEARLAELENQAATVDLPGRRR